MNSQGTLGGLSVEDARRIINGYSARGFFRVRMLGDRAHLEDIVPQSSHALRLQSQYEERTISPTSMAYHGGPVDSLGTPPGLWDLSVRRPTVFEDRTERVPVPHTERVQTCESCGGDGQVRCRPCDGWGRVSCSSCQGRGFTERQALPGQPDAQGRMTVPGQVIREDCTRCSGGKVICRSCDGRGQVRCDTCEGAGRVKTFDVLTVSFSAKTTTAVLDASAVPDHLIGKAAGDTLLDVQAEALEQVPTLGAEVDESSRQLLHRSWDVDRNRSCLLFQRLTVRRVPVYEITYRYQDSGPKKLWIYGAQQDVHAPGIPRPWGKLILVLGGVFLAAAAVLAAVVMFGG